MPVSGTVNHHESEENARKLEAKYQPLSFNLRANVLSRQPFIANFINLARLEKAEAA